MRINSQFNRIPKDSDASIMTSGLLGGQYIGITPGGAEEFLKQGDRIEFVQDALVLENLINQLAATFLRRDQGSAEGGNQGGNQDRGSRRRSRSDEAYSQCRYGSSRRCAAAAGLAARAAADDAAQLGPQELVTKVAQDTLRDLDAHRAEYKKNPKRVRELVDKNMLPHFDTAYAAQLVLAKHWRTATPEQRKRFVEAFYQSLLQNYGEALLEFTPDRLKILPFQGKPDDKVATVRSEVRRDNGSARAGELFAAQDAGRLEGLRRADRRRVVREVVPHRLRLGDPAEGPRCCDPAPGAAGRERHGAEADRAAGTQATEQSIEVVSKAQLESLGGGPLSGQRRARRAPPATCSSRARTRFAQCNAASTSIWAAWPRATAPDSRC